MSPAVTVCIAAIADNHEAIVSCVDTRVSTATTSFDPVVGRKMSGLRGWTILNSGTMSYAESLVDAYQALLRQASDNDPPTVQGCLESTLRSELPKYCAARYLTPYGLDMAAFLASRPAGFSDERWNEISRDIFDYSDTYDVELIVSGWGGTQEQFTGQNRPSGCIFSVSRNGVTPHSDEGFYTCGSGNEAAHSVLSFFNQQSHMTLAQTVYHVAAAKFMSETTAGVGPFTLMRVGKRLGEGEWRGYFIQPDDMREIRKAWGKHGAPRMPTSAEIKIVSILGKYQKTQTVTLKQMDEMVKRHIKASKGPVPEAPEPKG
jgi:hypothetical protein